MSARDHLEKAIEYAAEVDRLIEAASDVTFGSPAQSAFQERANTMARAGRLHLDLHRELALTAHFPDTAPGPALGIAAPVLDLPTRSDKRKAPADAAAEAPDQHTPGED